MDDTALLSLAADLARRAGAVILAVRARRFETLLKADRSPVTEADHAAEKLIVTGLRAATPDIPVVAEEEMEAGLIPASHHTYWLVDPLDGTREFAAGRDEFTVNIGLIRDGRAVLGAVGVPAFGELFGGDVQTGRAWKRTGAGEHIIRARPVPPEGLHVLASRAYATDPRLTEILHGRIVASVTNMGSDIYMAHFANGTAEWRIGLVKDGTIGRIALGPQ